MMESIGKYVISIVCTAAICGILMTLVPKNKSYGGIIQVLCGILLAITVVAPLAQIELSDFNTYLDNIQADGAAAAQVGADTANQETVTIIKEELEAYILDKAESMHLTVSVNVTLTDGFPPQPYAVEISGSASPYNQRVLRAFIASDLGIPEERQTWN